MKRGRVQKKNDWKLTPTYYNSAQALAVIDRKRPGEGYRHLLRRRFGRAYELGERFGDRDTQVLALVGKGRALVKTGEVEEGLALLDEATAAAVCGALRPYSAGLVYCITISACHYRGDYRLAAEWTEVANRSGRMRPVRRTRRSRRTTTPVARVMIRLD